MDGQKRSRPTSPNDDPVSKLFIEFMKAVGKWYRVSATDRDEVISMTVLQYLKRVKSEKHPIRCPERWLLNRAMWVARDLAPGHHISLPDTSAESPSRRTDATQRDIDLSKSPVWMSLTKEQRQVLFMHFVEELPISVAARQVGIPRSTAKSWVTRLTRRLERDSYLRESAGMSPIADSEHRPNSN